MAIRRVLQSLCFFPPHHVPFLASFAMPVRLTTKKIVKGKDLLDSLQNALIYIAADLFAFTRETGITLTWKHASGGSYATESGFPSFPGLQIMDLGPDRRIDS